MERVEVVMAEVVVEVKVVGGCGGSRSRGSCGGCHISKGRS